jgi:hypothetical protein
MMYNRTHYGSYFIGFRILPFLCVLSIASATAKLEYIPPTPSRMGFAVSAQVSPKESVREELTRQQTQVGLSLAYFYRGIFLVNFTDRSETLAKESFVQATGAPLGGSVTRDGNDIAFDLFRITGKSFLGVIRRDGSGFQEFPDVTAPNGICWSYDKSHLAMSVGVPATQYKPFHTDLILLSLATKGVRQIGDGGTVTSQCWSADGKHLVYEAGERISVYDIDRKESRVLASGRYATWSPGDQWLAFLDKDVYYAIKPSGDGRRVLFKQKKAFSGLWWSPDSRIVAYLSRNSMFESPFIADVEPVRLRVRRLADGSEDWVAQESAAYLPNYQWVTNKDLVNQVLSSSQSK